MENLSIETLETIMNVTVFVFVFLFGITIGSFLNVCIYRLPKGESLITNNSHCMTCGTEIKRYDLIPVLSWLILRGKCRACGARITPRYMLIEALTGFLFLGAFARFRLEDYGIYPAMLSLFIAGLVVLCFQDIDNQEMCVSVLIYTAVIAAATHVMNMIGGLLVLPETDLMDSIWGMLSVSSVLLIFGFVITPLFYNAFVSEDRIELKNVKRQLRQLKESDREYKKLMDKKLSLEAKVKEEGPVFGFGMGDVILMAAGGLMLGLKATIIAGFIGIISGAVYAVCKKATSKEGDSNAFAFGPFLIFGLLVGCYTNGALADLYLSWITRG